MRKELIQKRKELGFEHLLPVQEKAIPAILSGKDLMIQAQTGSGKTLAYVLPVLDIAEPYSNDTQALIITPTRELAMQVSSVANQLAEATSHHVITVIGGMDIHKQENALKHHPTVIIGTPGRIKDLLDQKKLSLSSLKIVVLDEVDQIIGTGQRRETESILHHVHAQIVCLSATKTEETMAFLPVSHEEIIQDDNHVNTKIDTWYIECEDRKRSLKKLLKSLPIEQAIIFTNYKKDANELAEWLKKKDVLCASFSSFFTESERIKIMDSFKKGKIRVLVATDAAARGLDFHHVTHIIHYDIPLDYETYIHRSGRTAHQGNSGVTITLLRKKEGDDPIAEQIKETSFPFNNEEKTECDLSKPLKFEQAVPTSMKVRINGGRKDKIRPKDVIGALCTKMEFSEIGVLEIQDSYTVVNLLKYDPPFVKKLDGISVKGKKRRVVML